MTDITIDPEFRDWIIPLRDEEFAALQKSIREEGCRDPLVIWNNVVIDGHHRYKICKANDIPFNTVEKILPDRDSVKLWMVTNQIARRNLESIQRIALVMKGEDLIAQRARENLQLAEGGDRRSEAYQNQPSVNLRNHDPDPSIPDAPIRSESLEPKPLHVQESPKVILPVHTSVEAAKLAKVSERTYDKGKVVLQKRPEMMAKIVSGNTSIHREYIKIKNEEKQQDRRENLAQKTVDTSKLPDTITLRHADFLIDYVNIPEGTVDCIITDPPYVREWIENYEAFAKAAAFVLKPGGFLVSYIGHFYLDIFMEQMGKHLSYYWVACIKHADQTAAVHSRMVQCEMKPILIFYKPPLTKPKRYFKDIIIGTGKEKDDHEWQQGEDELRQIFEPFTDPGDLVLDPFMGSGTTIVMAKKLGRKAIGYDIIEDNIKIAGLRLV